MCGIVGIAAERGIGDPDWLTRATDSLVHRGPDDGGVFVSADGLVGLAHRRLAIIDLSQAGYQPMQDASKALTIVFNGEIYNYQELRTELSSKGYSFRSQSDTEVLITAYQEWGVECLARLNGMFAFALYDARRRSLFLARDRAGEKPLYYAIVNGELRFASELKALSANSSNRSIDVAALNSYLAIGFISGSNCIVSGVKKIPPAHALLFDVESGRCNVWRYWNLPPPPESCNANEVRTAELISQLEELLEDSVRKQLVADVPVGVLLSGGVDSSLVTAIASRICSRIKTFTVGFPGFKSHDETSYARLIAGHFGTDHIDLEAARITPDILPILANYYDEPIIDSSAVPTYLVSQVVRKHCKVALGGDGGDELFGGYLHYSRLLWTHKRLSWLPSFFRIAASGFAENVLPVGFKGRNYLRGLAFDMRTELPLIAVHFDRASRRRLLPEGMGEPGPEEALAGSVPATDDLLQRLTRMDFMHYLPEDILVKVDRASMANSLEIRAPFLDRRIIEFAFGKVPTSLKAAPHERKILLRKLTERLLPKEFDGGRKQGFSIPLAAWLKDGPWRKFFQQVLLDKSCLFSRKEVEALMKQPRNSERLFGLVMLELWRKQYLSC